jgi:hypothetical protein
MSAIRTPRPVALARVLAYRHPGVVRRYCKEHHATPEEGRKVFREMLKWLYLCYRATFAGPEGFACSMFPELEKIDWMWHAFLLFTRDYADFCERYFGFFLHHVPNEDEGNAPPDDAAFRSAAQKQYAFVYDVLGAETLEAWHDRCQFAGSA